MKILFSLFRHLTEVVFPQLAMEYGWDTYNDKDIKVRLCTALGISVPVHPARTNISSADMKRLVALCYQIKDNPLIFLFL
jgi:hypothetical protein